MIPSDSLTFRLAFQSATANLSGMMYLRMRFLLFIWLFWCCSPFLEAAVREGFYTGGSVAYENMDSKGNSTVLLNPTNASLQDVSNHFNANDFSYEFFCGFQKILRGSRILIGFEPFGSYKFNEDVIYPPDLLELFSQSCRLRRTWDFGSVVRLGYILDDWLLYVLVGPEISKFKFRYRINEADPVDSFGYDQSKWLWGFRYGVGVERSFDFLTVGLQVSQTRFESHSFSGNDSTGGLTFSTSVRPRIFEASLRVAIPL